MKNENRCTIQNLNPESDFLLNKLIDTFEILEEEKKLIFHTVPRAKTKYLNRNHNMFQSCYFSKRNHNKSHDKLRKNKSFLTNIPFNPLLKRHPKRSANIEQNLYCKSSKKNQFKSFHGLSRSNHKYKHCSLI